MMQEILPPDIVFSKEAREGLIECCVQFIMMVSTESNDIAERESKKTIASEHVIKALEELGFEEYLDPIRETLEQHRSIQKGREKKNNKFQNSGLSQEELLQKQQELFRLSKSRLHGSSGADNDSSNESKD